MSTVEIFGFAPSTYTQSALLIAAEKGVHVKLTPLEFGADGHRALHPFARMPALHHGGVKLYETAAIGVYLDEAFPGPALQPTTAIDRALMWQWISAAVDYLYDPLVRDTPAHSQGAAAPDPTERNRVFDVLDAAVGKTDHLVADAPTLADFIVYPMVRFHLDAAAGEDLLAKRPKLTDWFGRMSERESIKTAEAA